MSCGSAYQLLAQPRAEDDASAGENGRLDDGMDFITHFPLNFRHIAVNLHLVAVGMVWCHFSVSSYVLRYLHNGCAYLAARLKRHKKEEGERSLNSPAMLMVKLTNHKL